MDMRDQKSLARDKFKATRHKKSKFDTKGDHKKPGTSNHQNKPQSSLTEQSSTKSSALPAIQSKENEYNFGKEFSKRKLESNWSNYDEIPDDEENEQMKAADFGAILLAPKAIGTHFTLNSEKHWDQSNDNGDDLSAAGTILSKLFQLNLTTLNNSVGRLPFYMRNDLPKEIFTDHEIADMEYKVSYKGEEETAPSLNTYNQNILNILRDEGTRTSNDSKDLVNSGKINESGNVSTVPTASSAAKTTEQSDRQTTKDESDLLDDIFDDLTLDAGQSSSQSISKRIEPLPSLKTRDDVGQSSKESTSANRDTSKSQNKPTKSSNLEDIQDWLDDFLNDG